MGAHLTDYELGLMKGKYASLARKYDVTTTYVKLISTGQRKLNSKLSKLIFDDIKRIVKLFRPLPIAEAKKLKNRLD